MKKIQILINKPVYLGLSILETSKTEDIYIDTGKDVETRFDTSNYELDRLLHERKNKAVIGLMKKMN